MRCARALARLAAAAVLLCLPALARAETVVVFAAASLKEALDSAARAFETASGHRVAVSYAASSALARQVESGAPAALFISADTEWVDYLDHRALIAPGSRRNLLANDLVLVAPAASTAVLRIAPGFALARALGEGRLAIANPDAVPAGKYARAALTSLGAWASVEPKLARAENVRAALALVARGEAPFAIVYRTDALAEKAVRVVDVFPAASHPPIVYPMAVLKAAATPAGHALAAHLAAPRTRATWERFGFRRID